MAAIATPDPVSGKVTGWVIRHPERPDDPALWRVLVVMADAADLAGGNIRLAGKTIAHRAVMSHWYARTLVDRAVGDGWLEVTDPGGSHRAAVYRFVHYDGPELSAPQSALSSGSKRASSAPISAPQERALSARAVRGFAPNGFTGNYGSRAGPAPDPQAVRSGAKADLAAAPEPDAVGRAEALRAARDALAAACPRCDEHGWLTHPDGSVSVCDHRRPATTTEGTA